MKAKSVLVLASSADLGKAPALEFAREGANVMLFGRSEDRLKQAQAEIRAATDIVPAYFVGDLTRSEDIEKVIAETVSLYGQIYALVNNSGRPPAGQFDAFDDKSWQSAYELILLSYIRSIRAVLPDMEKNIEGRIVNFTSSSTKPVIDNLILSNTFRMGVIGLSKSLPREVGRYNILVNAMCPGKIDTERVQQFDGIWAEKPGI